MQDDIKWIRSYAMGENAGKLGTVCVYQGSSAEVISHHAKMALLPVDEIIPVMYTVVKQQDPDWRKRWVYQFMCTYLLMILEVDDRDVVVPLS